MPKRLFSKQDNEDSSTKTSRIGPSLWKRKAVAGEYEIQSLSKLAFIERRKHPHRFRLVKNGKVISFYNTQQEMSEALAKMSSSPSDAELITKLQALSTQSSLSDRGDTHPGRGATAPNHASNGLPDFDEAVTIQPDRRGTLDPGDAAERPVTYSHPPASRAIGVVADFDEAVTVMPDRRRTMDSDDNPPRPTAVPQKSDAELIAEFDEAITLGPDRRPSVHSDAA